MRSSKNRLAELGPWRLDPCVTPTRLPQEGVAKGAAPPCTLTATDPECCRLPETADTGNVYVQETVLVREVIVPANVCGPETIDTESGGLRDIPIACGPRGYLEELQGAGPAVPRL